MTNKPYCFWDAKSLEDSFILIGHMTIALSVFIVSVFRLVKFRKVYIRSQDKYIEICARIHIFTALWALIFLVEYMYSVGTFLTELNKEPFPKDISSSSKRFAIFDKIPTFIVQTIFFQIIVFNYQGLYDQIQVQTFKVNHSFYRFYIHYIFKARLVLQVLSLLSLIIFSSDEQIWLTSKINIIYEIADSVMIAVILIYSLISFLRQGIQKNEHLFGQNVKAQIRRQYYMMIISDILAIAINIYFLIYKPYFTEVNEVSCLEHFEQHLEFFIGHNILGIIAIHFVPILWFLKMYNYKKTGTLRSYSQAETQQIVESQSPQTMLTYLRNST